MKLVKSAHLIAIVNAAILASSVFQGSALWWVLQKALNTLTQLCEQVSSVSSDFQQQVGSAVQAAISESLPQELAGPQLRAALEASLHSQLQHSLARPLQDSFTAAFQHHLMPAFEGACRDMFAQVRSIREDMIIPVLQSMAALTCH